MFNSMQEAFDKTVEFMEAQGQRALNEDDLCVYLTADGKKCAIGAHLPNDHPAQGFFGAVSGLILEFPELTKEGGALYIKDSMQPDIVRFWAWIQLVHDKAETAELLNKELDATAKRFRLVKHKSVTQWG